MNLVSGEILLGITRRFSSVCAHIPNTHRSFFSLVCVHVNDALKIPLREKVFWHTSQTYISFMMRKHVTLLLLLGKNLFDIPRKHAASFGYGRYNDFAN
ncbi:hypothetical protein CEXT_13231 [Caerostris extrusa]|uniref:Uncharacterized protein n=1 Tax=Caerostris extrusa TaxID=172846 RepID=A0AAV4Q8N3_CAEEX|nr:hypothetical protein CEXT_13231 [Caerostris extrusa]